MNRNSQVKPEDIRAIKLKTGELVLCGPSEKQFGSVIFTTSCSDKIKKDFNLALSLLHSFEYDEAEKVFSRIIEVEPDCAMAWWGVAMCNFHPLWTPPSPNEMEKGLAAIKIARSLHSTEREAAYISAIADFYEDAEKTDYHTRCMRFEKSMESLYSKYRDDTEAALFYALALDAAAEPSDKSLSNQRRAGGILDSVYREHPDHPGVIHYIIHTYDYPGIAEKGLIAARKYASVAPSSAHAQHMPSHIFTRLGLWDECIQSNLASISSARCYAESLPVKAHWDEELHGMDYLVYAYLQKAEDSLAFIQWDSLNQMQEVYPANFKVAYAFAAIPARCLLERKQWKQAAVLQIHPANFPWNQFPWQKAIFHFTRLMGMIHTGDTDSSRREMSTLKELYDTLMKQKDMYKANQVFIQIKIAEAWMYLKQHKYNLALENMQSAASLEDATEKHPVTPGPVIPASEFLGDMLMEMGYYDKALVAYREDLATHAGRLNALSGAALAAEKTGDHKLAKKYDQEISDQCAKNSELPALKAARLYLKISG